MFSVLTVRSVVCIELVNHAGYGKKISHKTISRPLREERKSEYDAQSAAVTKSLDQRAIQCWLRRLDQKRGRP